MPATKQVRFFWLEQVVGVLQEGCSGLEIQDVALRLKPFHLRRFQSIALSFLPQDSCFLSQKTETFLRATPLIPQFRRYPGFQREIVRATLGKLHFQGFYSVLIISLLPAGIRAKEEGEAEKRET